MADGRYGSASEVIRAGLRKLEDDERKVETLRALIEEGRTSDTADLKPILWSWLLYQRIEHPLII